VGFGLVLFRFVCVFAGPSRGPKSALPRGLSEKKKKEQGVGRKER